MMTNEQKMLLLVAENHTIVNALMYERLQVIANMTLEAIKENPDSFITPFTSPKMYQDLSIKILNLANETWNKKYFLFMDDDAHEIYIANQGKSIIEIVEAMRNEGGNWDFLSYYSLGEEVAQKIGLYTNYDIVEVEREEQEVFNG